MADQSSVEMIRRSTMEWNLYRGQHRDIVPDLRGADLSNCDLRRIDLSRADLIGANLRGANMRETNFSHANLSSAILTHGDLIAADFTDAILIDVDLRGANLYRCRFNNQTDLRDILLSSQTRLGDIRWNGVDLTVVNWGQLVQLGDDTDEKFSLDDKLRANRQLATRLRDEGLNDEADRFAYRARLWQRRTYREKGMSGIASYLGSLFLDVLAGYGYRPFRSFVAYLFVILGFMGLYLLNAHFVAPHLSWDEALVLSMSSFHGRGFFSSNINLGDTYARLGAIEAFVGLIIEVSFIATFTQRFFGR